MLHKRISKLITPKCNKLASEIIFNANDRVVPKCYIRKVLKEILFHRISCEIYQVFFFFLLDIFQYIQLF